MDNNIKNRLKELRVLSDLLVRLKTEVEEELVQNEVDWKHVFPYNKFMAVRLFRAQNNCSINQAYDAITSYERNQECV